MKVEFYRHSIEQADIQNVEKVLRSVLLTTGPVTETFEMRFSEYTGLAHTVGLNSCTAALHLALQALEIGPGDEVITTPMTFIATVTAILHAGATPVFVDVEKDTGLIDVSRIEDAITPRTRAIIPVHLYGTMADMHAIRLLADKYRLRIIEDCAHCIEGCREGIRPGQISDVACFSFYATKALTCGEGGAAATNDNALAQRIRTLRLHGMSKEASKRYNRAYEHWDMVALGWKYNMNDIQAALLVDQIGRLDENWRRKAAICEKYMDVIDALPGVGTPTIIGKSAMHLFTIWVDPKDRDPLLAGLQQFGLGVAVNYRAVHTLAFFRRQFNFDPLDFPNAEKIGRMTISIPFYAKLTDEEIRHVSAALEKVTETTILSN